VATSSRQLDRVSLEAQIFEIARGLLAELGSLRAMDAVHRSAHLERDLGLGSLERVELFIRLERAFGARLPERAVAEADTLDDVIAVLAEALGAAAVSPHEPWRAPLPAEPLFPRGEGPAAAPASAETWQEVLRYRALADAERPHLILWEAAGEPQSVSFGELHTGAQAVAAALVRLGITRGDSVALMLPTCREFFLTFAGVLLAGGVPVPIYPPVRADRIAEYAERQSAILRNADARLLVTFREAAHVAKLLQPRVRSLRGIVTAASLFAPAAPHAGGAPSTPVAASAGDLALLQYTSGSTGDPKGVMLTHANLLASVRAMGEAVAVRPDDVCVSWLPLYHDMGLIGFWLTPLYFGLPVVVLSPVAFLARPERWLWAIHRHRATLTAAPNFAYEFAVRKVAEADIEGLDLGTLRAAMNGAEPVVAETLERFAARFARYGFRREALTPVYGLAEASLAVTVPPLVRGPLVDRIVRDTFAREGRAVPAPLESDPNDLGILSFVSVGRPLPNHEVRIVDSDGHDVAERVEGALWFRGPSTTSGYFRNPDASAALFPEGQSAGWLDSGDRAYRAGSEVFITGRVKDIILKAGRNLYPHEVEEITGRVVGVRKGCVVAFGAADPTAGTERLIVVAETREREPAARQRIAAAITEQVSFAIGLPPDAVELLPPHSIPKTSSGKLRRNQTRQLYLAGTLGAAAPPPWLQLARLAATSGVRAAGQWLRRALELLYGVYTALVFVLWLLPTWLVVSLLPIGRAAARITSSALRVYFAVVGCRVRVVGREHLAMPPYVLVSNHTSYVDVLVLMATLGADYHFVAKREVHTMPFIGTFLRRLGHFAFDRSDPRERLRQAEAMEQALRRGESVLVFPEGTFTPQAGVRPFHLGAFNAAAGAHCPILPVALRGTRHFLRDGSYLPRPSRITVTICPPLEPQAGSRTTEWQEIVRLRDAARAAIGRYSGEPLL
jgi:fatty-acyl-CoA synthase